MSSKSRLGQNTIILSLCTLLNKGLLFVMIPFFTRWLSVEEYGTYDVFSTYVSFLIPIVSLASSNAIFRLTIDSDKGTAKDYITNGLYINLINFIIVVVFISIFFSKVKVDYFFSFIILLLSEIIDNYLQGYLRALKRLNLYGICRTATAVFTAISVTILVRFLHKGLNGLIIGYSLGFYTSSVLIVIITRFWRYFDIKRFSIERVKELLAYSWALIPNDVSWWIINVSDRQIINMFIGSNANGVYAVACKIPSLCSSVFGVFNISWQESATECLNIENKYIYFRSVYNKLVTTLLTVCIGVLSCNFIFFNYIFDSRYSNARLYTSILVASVIFSTIALFYGGIQISLKKPKENGCSTIVGAIINLVSHLALVHFIGLYAAAVSTLISNIVVMSIRKYQIKREFTFNINMKQILLCIIFVYYSVISAQPLSGIMGSIHILIAVFIFSVVNFKYLKRFINNFKKK